ncbi:hypothetical protein WA1_24135 [Scytonema hofmannii PCC 7110]|uniref:Uncharacterized protein n=1 Tax=Scytonema hofmannii PCC 7110 TaxID=128403 RepID=A0A139X7X2_9CYAN|nr:hypothetical protein [Scytonema hofmannii]KYC40732.1 hypothetical protein WA1_24135 [Scytonema hofmannii PCC 7110]USN26949.1 hypothetical protein [synthetic construct]
MTHPIYNEQQLSVKCLSELRDLYTELGCTRAVEDKRAKQSWATAILCFQEERVAKLELQLEEKTCATCSKFDAVRGCCKLFEMAAKPHWAMTSDCVNAISTEQIEVAETLPQPSVQPTEVREVEAVESVLEVPSTEVQTEPAPGYKFALGNGFTFYQKQCDVPCWIACKNSYRTIAYPELADAVCEALRRLVKEGIVGAGELLQIHTEAKKIKTQLTSVSSGDLTFKQISSFTYQVFNGLLDIGLIHFTNNRRWMTDLVCDRTEYSTPYEAAAALAQSGLGLVEEGRRQRLDGRRFLKAADSTLSELSNAKVVGILDSCSLEPRVSGKDIPSAFCHQASALFNNDLLDKPFTELTTVEWDSIKQRVSAEVSERIEELLELVEIEGDPDEDFGTLYKLWHGMKLLGTFYRTVFSGKWVARPAQTNDVFLDCKSDEDAKYWILYHEVTGSLGSDVVIAAK